MWLHNLLGRSYVDIIDDDDGYDESDDDTSSTNSSSFDFTGEVQSSTSTVNAQVITTCSCSESIKFGQLPGRTSR